MTTLRRSLIRLAYAKPELRPHLLPLLRVATSSELVTVPYLRKLIEAVTSDPEGSGESSYAASILEAEARKLSNEFSGAEPYPVPELWELLLADLPQTVTLQLTA